MKYVVIIGDGMADYPLDELDGKTPLQVANKPNMDSIASRGKSGLLSTIPHNMGAGSDIANLSIMGYDPRKYYTGRGPLEAASIGVELEDGELAFRCNLITENAGEIADYCADHITSEEARELIGELDKAFDIGDFYPGVSYRHLFVMRNGDGLECTPPHDVLGGKISEHLIKPRDNPAAKRLNYMILGSKAVLSGHPINKKREEAGKNPANLIWLWGQGKRPRIEPMKVKYGVSGAMVSAVDLLKGIGIYAGMKVLDVPGATGYYDTNYEAKAEAVLKALEDVDYVFVHVEAPDEASHAGDLEMKIKTIEDLDKRLVSKVLDNTEARIAVLPDHATPISMKTHARDPVPFAIYSPNGESDGAESFDEASAKRGSLGLIEGEEFMRMLLK
ncbi:MAG: cofactor-independent phosphoglycerate mutase [Candidatus Hydrothermarchaeales archaeon]